MPLDVLTSLFAALDAGLELRPHWNGAALDRLLDERHAALVERVGGTLRRLGWQVAMEVSFAHFGERGSIDILAWHVASRSLLVIEVKTAIGAMEETLRVLDVKVRLAPLIAGDRFGWINAAAVSRLLVVPEDRTVRRHLDSMR